MAPFFEDRDILRLLVPGPRHRVLSSLLGHIVYAIGFVTNFAVPKGIDDGAAGDLATSLVVDGVLLGLLQF